MHRTRLAALTLAATLAACGPEAEADAAEGSPVGSAAAPAAAPAAVAEPAADAPSEGAPPAGYYECYFYGDYGLQGSSMTSVRIHSATEYEAMEERGRYAFDAAEGTLRMGTGPLAGRVARVRESGGKPAIVFLRKDNEVDGEPTIDVYDTWCYFQPGGRTG